MDEEPRHSPIKGKKYSFPYVDLYEVAREKLLMKSTVICGDSGEGKSYITNTLLDALSDYINILHIFCATAKIDKSFPMVEYSSPLFVHEVLDMGKIKSIMEHCRNKRELLNNISTPDAMADSVKNFVLPLYKSTPAGAKLFDKTLAGYRRIRKIHAKFDYDNANLDEREAHNDEMVKMYEIIMYRCKKFLRDEQLTIPSEYKASSMPVLFHDINPHDVILTNDFGDQLGALKKDDSVIASSLVMKERHYGITTIHMLQNMNQIKKQDRGQVKVIVFLSPNSITTYITSLGIKGVMKAKLEEASEYILMDDKQKQAQGGKRKFPSVIYFKMTSEIMYTYADSRLELSRKGNVRLYDLLDQFVIDPSSNNPLMDIFG